MPSAVRASRIVRARGATTFGHHRCSRQNAVRGRVVNVVVASVRANAPCGALGEPGDFTMRHLPPGALAPPLAISVRRKVLKLILVAGLATAMTTRMVAEQIRESVTSPPRPRTRA